MQGLYEHHRVCASAAEVTRDGDDAVVSVELPGVQSGEPTPAAG